MALSLGRYIVSSDWPNGKATSGEYDRLPPVIPESRVMRRLNYLARKWSECHGVDMEEALNRAAMQILQECREGLHDEST